MSVSITELRQRLFELADAVVQSGEPLLIERKGVRLKLVRADQLEVTQIGRLARLKARSLVNGAALRPNESPALWSESSFGFSGVAESQAVYSAKNRGIAKKVGETVGKTSKRQTGKSKSKLGQTPSS